MAGGGGGAECKIVGECVVVACDDCERVITRSNYSRSRRALANHSRIYGTSAVYQERAPLNIACIKDIVLLF